MAGRAHRLKGYTIAVEVFGREKGFDANLDPIVRIQAGRLRRALEHYYLVAGGNDPIRIDVPRGGYVSTFEAGPSAVEPVPPAAGEDRGLDSVSDAAVIAVTPLQTLDAAPDQAFFANGLLVELVGELNRYEGVIGMPCAGPGTDAGGAPPRELGAALGARFVVGGTVRRDVAQIKVTAQLTDVLTGQQMWSSAYSISPEAERLIATQEDIARSVVSVVADAFGVVARRLWQESSSKPPEELSSYEALLRYHQYMLVLTPDEALATFAALQSATEREPDYGPAWAGLANLHCHALIFDRPGIEGSLETAFAHARRAAALSPDSQLARTILAYVYVLRGELDLFRREAEAALALNPHSPHFGGTIGYLHILAGDYERGCLLLERSIAVTPHHPKWFHHGLYACHFARADYEAAYREVVSVGHPPGFWDPTLRAAALARLGRLEEARAAGRELLEIKPDVGRRMRGILALMSRDTALVEDLIGALRLAGLDVD